MKGKAAAAVGKSAMAAEGQREEVRGKRLPVVLLHGFAQTPASWDIVADALQKQGHRTFVPDLYKRSHCSLEQLCAAMSDGVQKVARAEGAPVLVGYSMGGRIAAETLVRHPDLPLAGLVLESAGLGPADETARAVLAERNGAWAARLRDEGVAAFMDWWETLPLFATQRDLPPVVRVAIRAEREARDAESLARSLETWGAHHQTTEADTLAALAAAHRAGLSVRYLAGARDAKYAAVADRVRAAGLPAVLILQVGHNTHLEQPEVFLCGLDPFLA